MMNEEPKITTLRERLDEITERGHDGLVFVLHRAGIGSEAVAIGHNYEAMWDDCKYRLKLDKAEAIKQNLMFEVYSPDQAKGVIPKDSPNVFDRMAKARAARKTKVAA